MPVAANLAEVKKLATLVRDPDVEDQVRVTAAREIAQAMRPGRTIGDLVELVCPTRRLSPGTFDALQDGLALVVWLEERRSTAAH